jgi:hypothetical protein
MPRILNQLAKAAEQSPEAMYTPLKTRPSSMLLKLEPVSRATARVAVRRPAIAMSLPHRFAIEKI